MIDLKALRKSRGDKAARGKTATAEYNTLAAVKDRTAEQEAAMVALGTELDGLEAGVADLDGQIVAEETRIRRDAAFTPAKPGSPARVEPAAQRPAFAGGRTVQEPNPETTGGFKSMGEFANAIVHATTMGHYDQRLGAVAAGGTLNQNGGGAGEGYMVPPEFSQAVWEIAFETTDLLGLAAPEPTQSNSVFKPKDETTPWGAVGVQARWRSEGAQMTASKLNTTGELLTLNELYAFCAASSEVMSDAPMLQDRLTRQAGRAIAWTGSDSIMWGDGAGKPRGFMNSTALVTVAKDAGQVAKTLTVANLAAMAAHVLRTGGRPMWIANPDVMPQLVTLTIGNVPAFLPNNRPLEGDPYDGHLLGYPIMFSEHADTLGNVGDITCVNMAGYYAATKAAGVEFASSMHLYFDQNLTAFRWTFRLTGQPYLSKPVQPARGATAKSHFVALAPRA